MKNTTIRLQGLLEKGSSYISSASSEEMSLKPNPVKWSKKEIFGHLIDSGVNNLRRFTEIQFEPKPYRILKYNQDELVIANAYQHAELSELLSFWMAINQRIIEIMKKQTPESLAYEIIVNANEHSDLRYLMIDYVDHLEYHMKQITA